jgi:hypothetical protein
MHRKTAPWPALIKPGHSDFRQSDRRLLQLAIAARSPGQAATAAAASAAHAASRHGASRDAASGHSASRSCTSGYSATAAAAGSGKYDVVLKDSAGFLVEDVERCEANVGDFLLTERDFARRCGIPRHVGCPRLADGRCTTRQR